MHLDIHVPRFTWPGGPGGDRAHLGLVGPDGRGHRGAHAVGDGPLVPDGDALAGRGADARGLHDLSFAAAKTERLRFRLLVGGVTYRHPGLLAKTVTTLDVLSGGRAELGSGCGLVRARAPGARGAVPPAARALRAARGDAADLLPDVERRQRPLRGHALPAGRDAVLAAAGQLARGRGSSSAAAASERRCARRQLRGRLQLSSATPRRWRTRSGCCAATATTVGRDPAEIEVTALTRVPEDAGADAIVREAEALSAAGAQTIVIRSTGPEPSRWLEETWGPVVPKLADIG